MSFPLVKIGHLDEPDYPYSRSRDRKGSNPKWAGQAVTVAQIAAHHAKGATASHETGKDNHYLAWQRALTIGGDGPTDRRLILTNAFNAIHVSLAWPDQRIDVGVFLGIRLSWRSIH